MMVKHESGVGAVHALGVGVAGVEDVIVVEELDGIGVADEVEATEELTGDAADGEGRGPVYRERPAAY